jgi:hypothetical protein
MRNQEGFEMKKASILGTSDLEVRLRALDLQIHRLQRRGMHMSPPEREHAAHLKKLRLATKDGLHGHPARGVSKAS